MAFPGDVYAPPNVYTRTLFESPVAGALTGLKIPVFIGEGNEYLVQNNLELIRGSSSTVDQRVVQEDETGRAVVSVSATNVITLGAWDGELVRFQVRNFPIVSGDGTGTTTNNRSDVTVTVDGQPIVVLQISGSNGIIEMAQPPDPGSLVLCTYFYNRTDTLQTDDVSDQVDPDPAVVQGLTGIGDVDAQSPSTPPAVLDFYDDESNPEGFLTLPNNNTLIVVVDGVQYTVAIPPRSDYTMAQVATTISSLGAGSLVASTFINNFGLTTLQLSADKSVSVGSGSANAELGIQFGQADARVSTFYTFNGPIVDGTNGGVTTTDTADVTVRVDGLQVIPTAVQGSARAVTLPTAPVVGATVTITYWHNTWQNTFDYLANIGVTDITQAGEIPNASTYFDGVDFVLKDDKILWGTAVLTSSGIYTQGGEIFGENQILTTLVDNRTYLSECDPVITSSGGVAIASNTEFQLPFTPTTGNGRDTPLGQSLFQSTTNSRIDLPTHRPDLVDVYWGYDVNDALDRGQVEVVKVDGTVVTLKEPVPAGVMVYSSLYYNRTTDNEFTLTTIIPGPSGTGTYEVTNLAGAQVLNSTFDRTSKGSSLVGVTVEFPSGSELLPGFYHEAQSGSQFTGSTEEIVTIEFASRPGGLARYTAPGSGDYAFIFNESDHLRVVLDGQENGAFGTAGIDLNNPSTYGSGFFASLVSNEIDYTGGTGATAGIDFEFASNEELNLLVDGVTMAVTVAADAGTNHTVEYLADAINEAVATTPGVADGGSATTGLEFVLGAGAHQAEAVNGIYDGWRIIFDATATMGTVGESADIVSYDGTTQTATLAVVPTLVGFAEVDLAMGVGMAPLDTITLNGVVYTGTAGPGGATDFDVTTNLTAATDLAAKVTADVPTDMTCVDLGAGVVRFTSKTAALVGAHTFAAVLTGGPHILTDPQGNVLTLAGDTLRCSFGPRNGGVILGDGYTLFNPAVLPQYKAATQFDGPVDLTNGFEQITLQYVGDVSLATVAIDTTLTAGPWATAADLATEVATQINARALALGVTGPAGSHPGLGFFCEADADGRLIFGFQNASGDTAGFITFITDGTPADDFCVLAGIDTGVGVTGTGQMHLLNGPIARIYRLTDGGFNPYDRLILRDRILPGGAGSMHPTNSLGQMGLEVQAGSGNDKAGLESGDTGIGHASATVQSATLSSHIGFVGGQQAADGEPMVTLYDGTGVTAANNTFEFDLDQIGVQVVFTDATGAAVSPTGSQVPLGPAMMANTILWQISNVLASIPGNPFGLTSPTAAVLQGTVRQEGAGIRLTSTLSNVSSSIIIGSGNATSILGFLAGTIAQRVTVEPKVTASALMSNRDGPATFASAFMLAFPTLINGVVAPVGAIATNWFCDLGLATTEFDDTGSEYLYLQSLGNGPSGPGTGAASIVQFLQALVGTLRTDDALFPGTGLNIPLNDGDTGEVGLDGFFLWSNVTGGSGSSNDSVLNNGIGSDGVVGQTYRDQVTGLTLTILPRGWATNPSGPFLAYPTGSNATFRINVSRTFLTDANLPVAALAGLETTVTNTSGVVATDTAVIETFNKSGTEPSIGDIYYVSYTFRKQDYTTAFYTKMSAIESAYGEISPDNPVSLASYLAIINGAIVVGIKQVSRAEGEPQAALTTYVSAIDELEGVLPGNTKPDIITPLRGDSTDLYLYLRRSNAIQSSIRYRSERTSIIGMVAGSLPRDAMTLAETLSDTRMRIVYPDIATVSIQDALGNTTENLIDGTMLAAGLVGSVISANVDVATPWTGRRLVGYTQLARKLDAVEMNQVAQKGVTVFEERPPFLRCRHGLTTDMTNVLTKLPTIVMIADEVQRQARTVLEVFVGIKFLPGILSQIEGRLSMMLNALQKQNIIAASTGVSAHVAPDDPTVAEVEAYYQPVFPLLYLILTFHLRSSL